jgi:hypothetical protein
MNPDCWQRVTHITVADLLNDLLRPTSPTEYPTANMQPRQPVQSMNDVKILTPPMKTETHNVQKLSLWPHELPHVL